jgi:phage terminase large subunit
MPMSAIEDEIKSGMDPALVRQEFWCDFNAANVGSIYGDLMEGLDNNGSVCDFDFPKDGIFVNFDLGVSDSTAMWAWRVTGDSVDFVNYYEANGKPLSHYFDKLEGWGYQYRKIWLPHDARARTLQTGASILDQFLLRYNSGLVGIVPSLSLPDGIQATRWLLQKAPRFHATNCDVGAECLRQYRYAYDPDTKAYSRKPLHDRFSHGADAARYVALVVKTSELLTRKNPKDEQPLARPMNHSFTLDELFESNESPKGRNRI